MQIIDCKEELLRKSKIEEKKEKWSVLKNLRKKIRKNRSRIQLNFVIKKYDVKKIEGGSKNLCKTIIVWIS